MITHYKWLLLEDYTIKASRYIDDTRNQLKFGRVRRAETECCRSTIEEGSDDDRMQSACQTLWMNEYGQGKPHGGNHTEMCFSRVDELPASVETMECKPDKSCNENPLSSPVSASGKVPTNWPSKGGSSGSQATLEDPLVAEGSKSASNDLCARAEANAEDMYQLKFGLDESFPATESACWRNVASDVSTTSFDCKANKHRPEESTGMGGLTANERTTLEADVACGVSPSGSEARQQSRPTITDN